MTLLRLRVKTYLQTSTMHSLYAKALFNLNWSRKSSSGASFFAKNNP